MPFTFKLSQRLARSRWPLGVLALIALACQPGDSPTSPSDPGLRSLTTTAQPAAVTDLAVTAVAESSVTLSFTEVNDGTGLPAQYDVRWALKPISWGGAPSVANGTCATPVKGTSIGAKRSCTVLGLKPATAYEFQLVPFRGTLNYNAVFGSLSGVAGATTAAALAPVASVTLSPATSSRLVGDTVRFVATLKDAAGNTLTGRTVAWSSSNTAIASVDGGGLAKGVTAGSATITAAAGGISGTAPLAITNPVTSGPPGAVTDLAISVVKDTSVTLSFTEVNNGTGSPASYDVRFAVAPISWGSSSSVTRGTCATPLAGTAIGAKRSCTILGLSAATAYNVQLVAFRGTLNVNAVFGPLSNVAAGTTTAAGQVAVASVTISPSSVSGSVGQSSQFSATLKDASGNVLSGRTIVWTSSNTTVITVNGTGYATAVGGGSAAVVATSGGVSGQAQVSVSGATPPPPSQAPVAKVTLTPSSASIAVGGSQQFTATLTDANGNVLSGRTITWSSSLLTVGSVSASGLVSGLVAGSTSVSATSEGITGSAALTVSILPPTSGGWTNEPAGFSTITDYNVGGQTIPTCSDCSFGTGGWSVLNPNGNISSLSDPAGTPLSAPWDGQWRYPAGFVGGSAPGTMYYAGLNGSRDLYVGYWWKPSNPWQGHYTNVNKVSFLFAGDGGSGKLSEAIMYGAPGGPYKLRIILEFYTSDSHGSGSRWLTPNASNDNVVLGQWHKIEIHYRHSSSTTSQDGVVQWWMDGRLQGSYSDVNFVSEGWNMFQFSPTWGGTGDSKSETDYYWFDHIHLSSH